MFLRKQNGEEKNARSVGAIEDVLNKKLNTIQKQPLWLTLLLVGTLLTNILVISGFATKTKDFIYNKYLWFKKEEIVVNKVFAGGSIDYIVDLLGYPLYKFEIGENNDKIEYYFKRRGYWVQVITDKIGTVDFFSVSSCEEIFKPLIRYNPLGKPFILGKATFSEIAEVPGGYNYYVRAATANSILYEYAYGGNPSNYQTLVWGINDACPYDLEETSKIASYVNNTSSIDIDNPLVRDFRRNSVINTFGITAPFVNYEKVIEGTQLGVDRIKLRPYNEDLEKYFDQDCTREMLLDENNKDADFDDILEKCKKRI